MHRILHITDLADPLAKKIRAVSQGQLNLETVAAADAPASLQGFDAVLIGDSPLSNPLSDTGDVGPKLVQLTRGHHKDVDAAALIASGVTVAGSSPVLAPYVARHALELVISASPEYSERFTHGHANISRDLEDNRKPLGGKTVGIVGFGRVGRAMVDLCRLLGATVIYSDVRTAPHGSAAAAGIRRSTLDLLLSKSDIVSLHVQWGPTSNPLLRERELRLMGRDSVLVNTADGRLVDSEALAAALRSGRVRAALDIEDAPDSPLADSPVNVTTPYVAARSEEADENVAEFVVANVEAALSGREPDGLIEIIDYPPIGDPAFWSSKMSPRVV